MSRFAVIRSDGRSDARVIVDHVQNAEPGTLFTYEELASVLKEGTDQTFDRRQVQIVVWRANWQLLKLKKRELHNVEGLGYRVSHAHDHVPSARRRRKKGWRQYNRAVKILVHVREEEMHPEKRQEHYAELANARAITREIRDAERHKNELNQVLKSRLKETPQKDWCSIPLPV